ncbi:MAG: hypothetical protein H6Q14_2443 [Bacteroidetes bacterium]|nr:hypothetical protein [Bacteroidota bacterium]
MAFRDPLNLKFQWMPQHKNIAQVIAHELGHGRWRHTFDKAYGGVLAQGSTDNLMDYKAGNNSLAKWQWDQIVSPAWFTSPFEGDGEGEVAVEQYIKLDNDGVFFTPSGNPFLLKKGTKIYTACMDYARFPKWAVYAFEADGKKYNTNFSDNLSAGITFNGYYQKDAPSNKYNLPSEVTGYATYASLKKLDGKHLQMLLWQDKVSRTHRNDGEYKIRDISIPENLTQVEGSNTLDAAGCDYYKAILEASLVDSVKSADGRAVLKIYRDGESGKFSVEAELEGTPKNEAVRAQEAAIKAQTETIAEEKLNELGLSGSKLQAVKTQAEDGGEFYVKGMDGREWLSTIADLGQNVWENAALPENYWNRDKGYNNSTVHLPPTFAGVGDGVIDQVTQYPQLIKLGYDVATKPEVREGLWKAVKNISVESMKNAAVDFYEKKKADYTSDKSYIVCHTVGKDGLQVASLLIGAGGLKSAVKEVDEGVEKAGKEIITEVDDALIKQIDGADGLAKRATKDAIDKGDFDSYLIESYVDDVNDLSKVKSRKLSWEEVKALFKRGNDFNKKAKDIYDYNEIVLENGKRLDSYIPGKEIISRKATTLSEIKPETFEGYLKELTTKYKKGIKINSSKTSGILEGEYKLEIPTSNKSFFENSQNLKNLAKRYDVTIKYLNE